MTRRKRKNVLKYVIILVLVAFGILGGFLIWQAVSGGDTENDDVTTIQPTEIEPENHKVENSENKVEISEDKVENYKSKVEKFDGEDPNEKAVLSGVITYAGVNDGNLMVRINIDQYLAGGECKLELSRNGEKIYTESAEIVDSAATSTCKGFNVATANLGNGTINITVFVTSGEKTGTIKGEVIL